MAFNRPINMNNVQNTQNEFSVIPPGEYDVLIVKSEEGISKSSGKDMIKLELDILTPPYDKRKLWYYIIDDQYADSKVVNIFASAGKPTPANIHSGIFQGLRCCVKTKNREFNGNMQAEVDRWVAQAAPASSPAPAPASKYSADNRSNPDDIPF